MSDLTTTVFRPGILRLAHHPWSRALATRTRPGRAVAGRFVAGESFDDAMRVARELDRGRILAMLDLLGENVTAPTQAKAAAASYLEAIEAIARAPSLDCAITIKLTQLGLDSSVAECLANVEPIVDAAEGTLVMIDMEEHAYVDATLEVLRSLHGRYRRMGVCLQAYLHRTQNATSSSCPPARACVW